MSNYRRAKISGGMYFFTVNLADRKRTTLVDHIGLLKQIVREELAVLEVSRYVQERKYPLGWAGVETINVDVGEVA